MRARRWLCLCLLLTAASTGCKKEKPKPPPPPPKAAPAVLIGSVTLAAGQELPSYPPEQMERSVLAHVKGGTFPTVCSPPKKDDRTPVLLGPDGKLIGVMLAASEFGRQTPAAPPQARQVTIKDCRLTPRLIVGRVGDMLTVKNETDFPLLPGLGTDQFNQTLSLNQSREVPLEAGGVKIMMCGFTAPCGRTDIVVLAHPHFAVTDDKGEFRIEDFPPGETVRLNAWHPLFHETFIDVRVDAGETKRVELVLTPKPPPQPPAAATPPPKPEKDAKGRTQVIPD